MPKEQSSRSDSTGRTLRRQNLEVVSTPQFSEGELQSIAIVSPSDIWVVGGFFTVDHPLLALHFDGTHWRRVAVPGNGGFLDGVTALSTDDVWAVGSSQRSGTLIEHFNGIAWNTVAGPKLSINSTLKGIAAISGTDIWATGCSPCGDGLSGQSDAGETVLAFPSSDVFVAGLTQTPTAPGILSFIFDGKEKP